MALTEPIRVLLVEDRADDQDVARRSLERATGNGPTIDLDLAADLEAGVRSIRSKSYDLVVTDLALPDSTGLDTFDGVARAAGRVPVLVLSATETLETALECIERGAADYVMKSDMHTDALYRAVLFAVLRNSVRRDARQLKDIRARLRELI